MFHGAVKAFHWMRGMGSGEHSDSRERQGGVNWTVTKIFIAVLLIGGGIGCIAWGLVPFFNGLYESKDFANIGFVVLILVFIGGITKVRKTSRFVFWSLCFALILYADLMFLFYEDLFFG